MRSESPLASMQDLASMAESSADTASLQGKKGKHGNIKTVSSTDETRVYRRSKTSNGLPKSAQALGSLVNVIEAAQQDVKHLADETAQAVNSIIQAVETILGDERFLLVDEEGVLSDRLIGILQACSFQDLTGQRLSRVVEALQDSHSRFSKGSTSNRLTKEQKQRAQRREDRLAHGPQQNNAGTDQAAIDSLFD
jgi:hypothetical protein